MKTLLLASAFLLAASAPATVVNFDDLTGSGTVAAGYGGVADWHGFTYYDSPDGVYNPSSPSERVYAPFGTDGHVSFGQNVKFDGAYFAGYGADDGGFTGNIFFDLYLGGNLVASSGALDPSATPTFLSSGYTGQVDELYIRNTSGPTVNGYWVMDDLTYNTQAVPEPATMAVPGLGALALRRRKRA